MTRYAYDTDAERSGRITRTPQEEGEYEWASYNKDGEHSKEARLEPAVFYQPLGEAVASQGEAGAGEKSPPPLCRPGSAGPCALDTGGSGRCIGHSHYCKRHVHGPQHGENEAACGDLGGSIAGTIGGVFGDLPGAVIGGAAGQKAGEVVCHE